VSQSVNRHGVGASQLLIMVALPDIMRQVRPLEG
jgi:hypothetical protein